jgi:hypothetical protein
MLRVAQGRVPTFSSRLWHSHIACFRADFGRLQPLPAGHALLMFARPPGSLGHCFGVLLFLLQNPPLRPGRLYPNDPIRHCPMLVQGVL